MKLGIIGNCQFNALINECGEVVWLCWPRFDSEAVFGKLLDPKAGSFQILPDKKFSVQQDYLRNTNILRSRFQTKEGSFEVLDFAPRFLQYQRIYRPTMLIRIVRPLTGECRIKVSCEPTVNYGKTVPITHWGSNHIEYEGFPERLRLTTNAARTYIQEKRSFVLTETKYFILTWGQPLQAPLVDTSEHFFQETKKYWQTWVKHCTVPRDFQKEVIRSALVLKLHQFEDTGAIVAATTTSLPEAPNSARTWDYRFCWLRDAFFTLSAFRYLGQFEEMERFVQYLRNIAQTSDGSLQPVYAIDGYDKLDEKILDHLQGYHGHSPVRVGNAAYTHKQHDIYGEMILAMEPLFTDQRLALGDNETVPPTTALTKMVDFIERVFDDKDAGIWEFRTTNQVHTFSLLLHWAGCKIARMIGEKYQNKELRQKAATLEKKAYQFICKTCWNSKLKCYVQAPKSQHVDASLFMMVNLGFLQKDDPRSITHVASIAKALDAGNGLLYRYAHPDDFGKPETAFIVCAFWYVEALARLGNTKKALEIFTPLLELTNPLGLYSEGIHPKTLELWGNFPQTYSHVGLINAAFRISGI